MNQIYPDVGLVEWLRRAAATGIQFHLYVNDLVPDRDTKLADLEEAAWAFYAPIDVLIEDWTLFGVTAHRGVMVANTIEFVNDSGMTQDAYGYYATDTLGLHLLMVTRWDAAPFTREPNELWAVIPMLGDLSEFASVE